MVLTENKEEKQSKMHFPFSQQVPQVTVQDNNINKSFDTNFYITQIILQDPPL